MRKKHIFTVCIAAAFLLAGCKNTADNGKTDTESIYPFEQTEADVSSADSADREADAAASSGEAAPSEDNSSANASSEAKPTASANKPTKAKPAEKPASSEKGNSKPKQCSHKNTVVKNATAATCTKAGYTGDTCCKDCGAVLKKGSSIAAFAHKNTIVKNAKGATETSEGYTGDTYCADCNKKLASGKKTPKTAAGTETYQLPDGSSLTVPIGTDVLDYTLKRANKRAKSQFAALEKTIFDKINAERKKNGLLPLLNYDGTYYYVQKRATEVLDVFDHVRPNGTPWYTVYTDEKIFWSGTLGENLGLYDSEDTAELANALVTQWMLSPDHRNNILSNEYNYMTVAIAKRGTTYGVAQGFYG